MFIFFRILTEGVWLAIQELWSNKLRSMLSLLGITIGIFCVISVLAVIDSLERNIKLSFESMGENVVYITKESWDFSKLQAKWFDYIRRPEVSYKEYKAIQEQSELAEAVVTRSFLPNKTLIHKNNRVESVIVVAGTHGLQEIFDMTLENGRYFSQEESHIGQNKVILGANIAEKLFPYGSFPIGKDIKVSGRKMKVIGVLEKEGESVLSDGMDDFAIVPYHYMRKYVDVNSREVNPIIAIKAKPDISTTLLEDEVRGIMRAKRKLKPSEEDNFEFNQMTIFTKYLDIFFSSLNWSAFIIGGFAILVGGFGIANIMFVTVKERTKLIGIKKSLGAKQFYILFEFLIESVMLTLIGGFCGLLSVYLVLQLGNQFLDTFELVLGMNNIIWGMAISIVIGIVAGFIPAWTGSRLDPVEAMRH